MNLLSLLFYLQMRHKAPNDLHGLSYSYYTDLFKILHYEQPTGIPLPCQLFQPIKLSQQSGRKPEWWKQKTASCSWFLPLLSELRSALYDSLNLYFSVAFNVIISVRPSLTLTCSSVHFCVCHVDWVPCCVGNLGTWPRISTLAHRSQRVEIELQRYSSIF